MVTGTMAIDQYGDTEHALGKHPRRELMRRYGRKSARKMYVDTRDGETLHVGWIVAGHWFTVFNVERMERRRD